MKLSVLNKEMYDAFAGLEVSTATKMNTNEWECETPDGFMHVKVTAAVLGCSFSERLDNIKDDICIVGGALDKKDKLITSPEYTLAHGQINNTNKLIIPFDMIVDFMKWKIDPNNIWDG